MTLLFAIWSMLFLEILVFIKETNSNLASHPLTAGSISFSNYMYYNEQVAYLRNLEKIYPHIITVSSIGQTYEGRDLLFLKISNNLIQNPINKPSIFIDAGIHSNEWIASAVALYIIHQLVENDRNSPMFQSIDWYFIPNFNPDGYEYTQKENRLWRKNRRVFQNTDENCIGTDMNRNFGYYWMHDGASNDSCDHTYGGPHEFSESETQSFKNWFLNNGSNVKLYLTFHSFGELLLYPYGFNTSVPENVEELHQLGERVALVINQRSEINSSYKVNSSARGLYAAAGISTDWVKGVAGVDLAYLIELPKGDSPFYFMLPSNQILPIVQETWEGIKEFYKYIEENYVTNNAL